MKMKKTIGIIVVTMAITFVVTVIMCASGALDQGVDRLKVIEASITNNSETVLAEGTDDDGLHYKVSVTKNGKFRWEMNGGEEFKQGDTVYHNFHCEWTEDVLNEDDFRKVLDYRDNNQSTN